MIVPTGAGIILQAARRLAGLVLAPALALALAGCGEGHKGADGPPPSPLFYELASADGAVEGWMLGTIHALPADTEWRTPAISQAIADADLLIVEVAALDDRKALAAAFAELGTTPGLPPLERRLPEGLSSPLADLLARGDLSAAGFADTETWAAAIMLAQVGAPGDPDQGVDRALIREFAERPVRELEGVRGQLAIFDRLPEEGQRTMLAAVVSEAERTRADPARLQRAWLSGDAARIEQSTREGFLADPALREALLTGRNRRWAAALVPVLEQGPRPLIAVGAAHLVGPEGLARLLEAEGYTVRRLR